MIRPKRMKRIELTVLERDADKVIEYLGKTAIMHLALPTDPYYGPGPADNSSQPEGRVQAKAYLERIKNAAAYLSIDLPSQPGPQAVLPSTEDDEMVRGLGLRVELYSQRETMLATERQKVEETAREARAFANLKAPFADLEHLSYLSLHVGRLEPKKREELIANLGDRAVVIPLGDDDRVLAASSRKGRFALDSELKKSGFVPLVVPPDFTGVPTELLTGLDNKLEASTKAFDELKQEKLALAEESRQTLVRLAEAYLMAQAVDELKANLQATQSAYRLSGWVAAEAVKNLVDELSRLADGRIAIRSYDPQELASVREGDEKVPVALNHGGFVGGFEPVVFSYGAPLYGTIDPTIFVALSFTLLFGLMFGDVGQGFVLLLLGLATTQRGLKKLASFRRFSSPLIAVGLASMLMGCLNGEVFANDTLLVGLTRRLSGFLTGHPVDRLLHLMPTSGSLDKLLRFFGFTIAIGVLINSIGLIINIANNCILKRYEKALFAKTGLAGALLFWYALSMVIRLLVAGPLGWFDAIGLGLPILGLFFGPAVWRLIKGQRPVLEHGATVFFMEGFVEILESASYYLSNTVSFLRVGAFALSHAVLSFIIFALSDIIAARAPAGRLFSILVLIFGNTLIIVLEGLIVAIQVVRLQYYEFFSKFFTETGLEFTPFRFNREVQS